MKLTHFEAFAPICPRCLIDSDARSPLQLSAILVRHGDSIEQGTLLCSDASCLREYPISDGSPMLVADIRDYVTNSLIPILARADLSEQIESLLGDSLGPGSAFDAHRQYLSTYAFDHYGDLDPKERAEGVKTGSILRLLERARSLSPERAGGGRAGCRVLGRALELRARRGGRRPGAGGGPQLRHAAPRRGDPSPGGVSYPRRRVGIVYDRREFEAHFPSAPQVDFWACDALALPFADKSFGLVASINVLDCVSAPLAHLAQVERVLQDGGQSWLSTPYDWSLGATPVEGWLGGHSQRSESGGASDQTLRAVLSSDAHPGRVRGLEIRAEDEAVPWTVRLHERSHVSYLVHLVIVEAQPSA